MGIHTMTGRKGTLRSHSLYTVSADLLHSFGGKSKLLLETWICLYLVEAPAGEMKSIYLSLSFIASTQIKYRSFAYC